MDRTVELAPKVEALLGLESTLADAALLLARYGIPVFPCVAEGKRPAIKRGFLGASNDPDQVRRWWQKWPNANLAVPTGAASGIDVVDVDRSPENDGLLAFNRARDRGLLTGWSALVTTPSNGLHVYFPADNRRHQRPWQAASAHIDFRGDGGYVLLPPSKVRQKSGTLASYNLSARSVAATTSVDASALRKFLVPGWGEPKTAKFTKREGHESFARLADWVAHRAEGERNASLFYASCRMVEAGQSPDETLSILGPAAERSGLGQAEILTTVQSAFRSTSSQPLPSSQFRDHLRQRRSAPAPGRSLS